MNPSPRNDPVRLREAMVRDQLIARGVKDQVVLDAMRTVPRHVFIPDEALHVQAYGDSPLPIGYAQTISQPYVVACMSEWLEAKPGMSVLEIGTGSGYQAAVLAAMGMDVFTVERVRELYFHACEVFRRMNMRRIRTKLDDGTQGWPDAAPFDRILVAAGGPEIPQALVDQLADPGIMVMPLGARAGQKFVRVIKKEGMVRMEDSGVGVAFVDLVSGR